MPMATRRMFSLKVIDTDLFLEMPISTRLLYYDLAMRADDDGFVDSPLKIIKTVGATNDDYKVLVAKQYIIPFRSGICVIKHWHIHNLIRQDRHIETEYKEEKDSLQLIDNKYVLKNDNQVATNECQMSAQVRLGKVSIIKDMSAKNADECFSSSFLSFLEAYPRKMAPKKIWSTWKRQKLDKISDQIMARLKLHIEEWNNERTDIKYIPLPTTYLNADRWKDPVITEKGIDLYKINEEVVRKRRERERETSNGSRN
jgi:hypothetical protein